LWDVNGINLNLSCNFVFIHAEYRSRFEGGSKRPEEGFGGFKARSIMARVTVEDCMENVRNRFALVILAAQRTRALMKGSKVLVKSKNRYAVTALREIAAKKVVFNQDVDSAVSEYIEQQRRKRYL